MKGKKDKNEVEVTGEFPARPDLSDGEIRRDFLMLVQTEAMAHDAQHCHLPFIAMKVLSFACRITGQDLRKHLDESDEFFIEELAKHFVSYSYGKLKLEDLQGEDLIFAFMIREYL